ncbi:MAG: DUF3857 domain-containing protein [Planctomycetes bacterium]|nr:DUF3857 domain-containing protein [Planctomycetota bacterium]
MGVTPIAGRALIAAVLSLLSAGPAVASDRVTIGPVPEWVTPLAIPAAAAESGGPAIGSGIAHLLSERQVNRVGETPQSFHRRAWLVRDASGVQLGSEFSVDFDPTFEEIVLHTLRVHRDGAVIDRLDADRLEVIQRETQLDRQVYDGGLTAFIMLEDIRPGDVIESGFTRRGANPVLGGHFYGRVGTQWSVPVGRAGYRLLWPADRALVIRRHGTDLEPTVTRRDGTLDYRWELADVPPLVVDSNLPEWYDPYPWIQISDFADWNAVARWAAPMYAPPRTLPPDVAKQVGEIRASVTDAEDRILAAVRFVQDEIRYLAITLGTGTYQPSPPSKVIQRRFGDCKDKSALLVSMLRALDVPADVAFVNTWYRDEIASWQATPSAFDHAIVRLEHDGGTIWIDPTDAFARGPLRGLDLPEYGWALVVSPDTTGLTEMRSNRDARSGRDILATFRAQSVDEPVHVTIETEYDGGDADSMRRTLRLSSLEEYAAGCRDYYASMYPSIESTKPLEVADDERRNRVRTVEHYVIPKFWTRDEEQAARIGEFYPLEIDSVLDSPRSQSRTMPLAVSHPLRITYRTRVHLSPEWSFEPETEVIRNAGLEFRYEVRTSPTTLAIDYTLRSLADHVSPAECAQYMEDLARIRGRLSYAISYPDSRLAGYVPVALGATVGSTAMGLVAILSVLVVILGRRAATSRTVPSSPTDIDGAIAACVTIWTAPRATMRRAFEGNPGRLAVCAVMVTGVFAAWDMASVRSLGDRVAVNIVLAIGLVAGPVLGLVRLYIGGALLTAFGHLLGGTGDGPRVRAAIGYASLIPAVSGLIWIPGLLLLRKELFTEVMPRASSSSWLLGFLGAMAAVQIISAVWTVVALVRCLAEAHRFSAWRAFGAVLLLVGVFVGLVLGLAVIVVMAMSL